MQDLSIVSRRSGRLHAPSPPPGNPAAAQTAPPARLGTRRWSSAACWKSGGSCSWRRACGVPLLSPCCHWKKSRSLLRRSWVRHRTSSAADLEESMASFAASSVTTVALAETQPWRHRGISRGGQFWRRLGHSSPRSVANHVRCLSLDDRACLHFNCTIKSRINLKWPGDLTFSTACRNGPQREGSGLPINPAASANQNGTSNILREKLEEWPPCLPHKLKHSNTAKDCWIPNKIILKISTSAHWLMTWQSGCNQNNSKQHSFERWAQESDHHALHWSTCGNMAAMSKACGNVTMVGGALDSVRNPLSSLAVGQTRGWGGDVVRLVQLGCGGYSYPMFSLLLPVSLISTKLLKYQTQISTEFVRTIYVPFLHCSSTV